MTTSSFEADAAAGGPTKRQRRKHVNPSNTWPQQPRIQSPAARAKANLRVAGLLRKEVEDMPAESPEFKIGRVLGGTNERKRHHAVLQLQQYLKKKCDFSSKGLSELDLLKLWKGLWYTLFLADKVPVQEELSKRLVKLMWCVAGTEEEDEYAAQVYLDMCELQDSMEEEVVMEEVVNTLNDGAEDSGSEEEEDGSEEDDDDDKEKNEEENNEEGDNIDDDNNEEEAEEEQEEVDDALVKHCRGAHLAALFVKTFFQTMQREWGNMDKHRIDKFYTLVRYMMHEIFTYMAKRHWNRGIIFLFNDILRDEVLFRVPNGLRCHLIDIELEELSKVSKTAVLPLTEATFMECLDPFFLLAQDSDDRMVQGRVLENILQKFLLEYSVVSTDVDHDLTLTQVHVGTVANFLFELASDSNTQERYRKSLYDMYKQYKRQLEKVGTDVELDAPSLDETATEEADEEQDDGTDEPKIKKKAAEKTDEQKKSKKSKHAKHGPPDVATEEEVEKRGTDEKKKKKHKKKKRASLEKEEDDMPQPEVLERFFTSEQDVEKEKKSKKKKRKSMEGNDEAREDQEDGMGSEDLSEKKKKKKRRKSSVSEDEEEVITITTADQKKAREASSSKKKKKKEKSPKASVAEEEPSSDEKRVKFGAPNRAKSHIASMKALVTMEQPELKTPDRGILREGKITSSVKRAKSASKKKKHRRKSAADYFELEFK